MIEELTEDDRRTNGGRMEIDRRANDSKTICNMFFYIVGVLGEFYLN